ncbi:hypothetical protein niasHT_017677 [Heterodera trifolii]|uniref:Uncharacterized protein n=1 Tax=Heterodera trifolii TaxID=157864 RepID=A0ABD2L885_9BILA
MEFLLLNCPVSMRQTDERKPRRTPHIYFTKKWDHDEEDDDDDDGRRFAFAMAIGAGDGDGRGRGQE